MVCRTLTFDQVLEEIKRVKVGSSRKQKTISCAQDGLKMFVYIISTINHRQI